MLKLVYLLEILEKLIFFIALKAQHVLIINIRYLL